MSDPMNQAFPVPLSIWEKESFFAPKDVLIIGSGFVGLWSAWHLKKRYPKLSITILERGLIPTGASTRNAGFACFGSITELMEDSVKLGMSATMELVEMRYRGLQQVSSVFRNKDIDFKYTGGYDLIDASMPYTEVQLKHSIARMNEELKKHLGEKNVYQLADRKIRKFGLNDVVHAVENRFEGYLHSGKLAQQLLAAVQGKGVQVINNISVSHVEEAHDGVKLFTDKGLVFTAAKILACTNAFATMLFPGLDVVPARGQVLLTSPVKGLKLKGCFHYDHGFYYFRNLGNRVLLGGARNKAFEQERTTEFKTSEFIQQELERFLDAVILRGKEYTITDRWSGIMAMGAEKMPIIRKFSDNISVAVRMSGMGVALAPVVGERIAKEMF